MVTKHSNRFNCNRALNKFGGIGINENGTWLACHGGEVSQYRTEQQIAALEQYNWLELEPITQGQMGLI